ncbi:MAG TPA: TetR/AcrR family transcriptional regulator [Terracidiphilus sp.]|nr:TetR/AcrR family transcriptional regulator [Terracidiphilus sp.]
MRKGELTRQRIIELAAPLFNQRGFAGCSMQDVMEATGLEKGGLYRHFHSKEELAAEALRYSLQRTDNIRTDHLDQTHGSVELLRSFVERFVETSSPVPGGCPLMNTAIDSDDGNATLRELAREGFSEWRARLSKIVAEGIRRGEIRKKTEPRTVANLMIATLEGALMMSRLEGKKAPLKDAKVALAEMLSRIAAH